MTNPLSQHASLDASSDETAISRYQTSPTPSIRSVVSVVEPDNGNGNANITVHSVRVVTKRGGCTFVNYQPVIVSNNGEDVMRAVNKFCDDDAAAVKCFQSVRNLFWTPVIDIATLSAVGSVQYSKTSQKERGLTIITRTVLAPLPRSSEPVSRSHRLDSCSISRLHCRFPQSVSVAHI
jgi:hypothetical protein